MPRGSVTGILHGGRDPISICGLLRWPREGPHLSSRTHHDKFTRMSASTPAAAVDGLAAPLYVQIKQALRGHILDGRYPPLSRMPSESELQVRYGVSRITVRQALGDLQKEGLIFTLQGKGSFVARPKACQNVTRLMGLAESFAPQGIEVLNDVLGLGTVPADEPVAAALGLAPQAPVTEIRRLRRLDREPVSLELTWVGVALGQRLAMADLGTRDVFQVLENDCGIELGHAELTLDAALADAELAQHLGIEPGAPVLHVERLTHDAAGRPLDYEHLYYRADAFQYRLRIDRGARR